MKPQRERLIYLDAIRAVAALSVVISHYIERTPLHQWAIFDFLRPGQFGVVVFFILSGFVIPFSFTKGATSNRTFLVSRLFRLYPAYWLSILLACFAITHFLGADLNEKRILANVTMLQALTGYHNLFGVYWTLFVELVFYALCIALSWAGLLGNLKIRLLMAITFLLAALAGAAARHYLSLPAPVGILSSLSLMLFGGLWRSHVIDRTPKAKAYCLQWIALFLLCFPLIALLAYNVDQGLGENAYTYIGSYFTALLFFITTTTLLKLKNKVLIFLGSISYSLYLIHPFFLEWVTARFSLSSQFNLAPFALYLLVTLACSTACYVLIEKNGIRLGRRLNAALDRAALKNATPVRP
ncbi:acyltransferase family protein [Pseudomonas frederiksbergensis]|uniref:Acyltransferase 3 domain-containing protein n=1 Tax=Pseudomonas frederiksbergensis TaxID=104087 RepID=A0A423KJS5_9PSED|nr:acyltransferase [Pseudomonas frederiksbergensis]RON53519.1 hypothetical protein BK665_14030 [Pseudomonas frederiksbergensis]